MCDKQSNNIINTNIYKKLYSTIANCKDTVIDSRLSLETIYCVVIREIFVSE